MFVDSKGIFLEKIWFLPNDIILCCLDLMNRMVLTQKRGQRISFSSMCLICHTPLLHSVSDHQSGAPITSSLNSHSASNTEEAITAFNCSHSFHSDCLALQQLNTPQIQGRGMDSRTTAALPSSSNNLSSSRETPFLLTYFCPQCDTSR